MSGLDHKSYRISYTKILVPVITDYCDNDYGIEVRPDIENLIWNNYVKFNRHCREEYMKNPDHLLDRHKIVACYIYAILKTDVLSCSLSKQSEDDKILLLNERLALCFGMSLLRSFIHGNIKELTDEDIKKRAKKAFEDELAFPIVNHDNYKNNLLLQLYYTKKEGNYNILALADTIFFIEHYNLIKNDLPEDLFKKNQ